MLVTNVLFNGSTHSEFLSLSYQFQASKVKIQYWEQASSGGKGAESQSGWDIKSNKEA
ncbi:similar to virulence factor for secretion apparatus, probable fragment [Erwinia pyrifoliae Ep1/96]|nr:similar to virulence factor for secretion apparatus, probable fragment [Erwinia pyrifoliae Ep1/96]